MNITYPSNLYREEEVLNMWKETYGETKLPRSQRPVSKYSINDTLHLIALDGDKIAGYTGWADNGSYSFTAGIYVHETYKKKNIANRLMASRLKKIGNKPIVASFAENYNENSRWVQAWKRRGWIPNPSDDEIPNGIPQEVIDYEKGRPKLFAVYSPNAINKAWNILKPYSDTELLVFMEN
tara:strand:+ start:3391 stop:3933 length:543 start_codon:yes stop_codon:yes gene_type:complete